jgi:hypothetical protein
VVLQHQIEKGRQRRERAHADERRCSQGTFRTVRKLNIQAGTSSQRSASDPSSVHWKVTPSIFSIVACT